ncbi:hypothetical protein GGR54DRAFT_529035 [Hypoxylon sp. NC1633]|nr:hypothetical protein GGR54DRAFT_529035 [Hypoxylon sp. NC1633]
MQYSTAALCLISATLSLAAPTSISSSSKAISERQEHGYAGFAVPTIIKIHDGTSGQNTADTQTATARKDGAETSTLYDIPIPGEAAGKTCTLLIRAAKTEDGDVSVGEQAMDIFKNRFLDQDGLASGNQRDTQLARVRFDAATGFYQFDEAGFANPSIESFPCPAGKTLHWESVAVGEFDINFIQQDFTVDGANAPNGFSVGWW